MNSRMHGFFFKKIDGRGLGILRILIYASVLIFFSTMPMEKMCVVPDKLKTHLTVLGPFTEFFRQKDIFISILWIWKFTLAFSMIGFLSFISMPLAFISTGIVFAIHSAYSCGFHGGNQFFLAMGILMFSDARKYVSIDRYILRIKSYQNETHVSYWPVRLIQINFVTMFFFAGIAKLKNSGLGYITADEFYSVILTKKTWGGSFSWFLTYLLDHPLAARALGAYAFLIELVSPLAFLNKRVMTLIILSLALMQLMIYLNLEISSFNGMLAIYAFWIDWDRVLKFYDKNHT